MKLSLRLAILFVLCVLIYVGAQGCGGVQIKNDPKTRAVLLEEAGYNATFFILRNQSDSTITRVEIGIAGAEETLETQEIAIAIESLLLLVQSYELVDHKYAPLARTAIRLLGLLLDVDLSIPENRKEVIAGVRAFLAGAKKGLQDVNKQ